MKKISKSVIYFFSYLGEPILFRMLYYQFIWHYILRHIFEFFPTYRMRISDPRQTVIQKSEELSHLLEINEFEITLNNDSIESLSSAINAVENEIRSIGNYQILFNLEEQKYFQELIKYARNIHEKHIAANNGRIVYNKDQCTPICNKSILSENSKYSPGHYGFIDDSDEDNDDDNVLKSFNKNNSIELHDISFINSYENEIKMNDEINKHKIHTNNIESISFNYTQQSKLHKQFTRLLQNYTQL